MPITFRPTPKMNVNDICAYTAAYIFMHDDEQLNEYVIFNTHTEI
jgi:hypothetical protein